MFTFLFDDNRGDDGSLLFEKPHAIIRADEPEQVTQALADLDDFQKRGYYAAGFLSFELGLLFEPKLTGLLPKNRTIPLLMFGIFEQPERLPGKAVEDWLAAKGGSYDVSGVQPALSEAGYARKFACAQGYISAGDIYQLNLTFNAKFNIEGSRAALFADLRRKQRVSHGAFVEAHDFSILSLSPELFMDTDGEKLVTRPMKGTAPRGLTAEEDERLHRWLSGDAKSRAENLMIVDLMRNDLARIARAGTVRVPDLFTVDAFETLLQMTSGVEAKLAPGHGIRDVLRAIFPPGSVTGAPKIRAMEIIRELENEPRGVYTGAIGYLRPYRGGIFNVAIRTIVAGADGKAEIGIGSGVVNDSKAHAEYEECLLKLRFLTAPVPPSFDLLETLLWQPDGGYALLQRHLNRMEASARRFGFRFNRADTAAALEAHALALKMPHRVRLTLAQDGHVAITNTALPEKRNGRFTFVIAPQKMNPDNIFLYHKTTNRAFYDDARVRLAEISGCDEVVFLNTRDELTEGSFTNLFLETGGELLTPPIECGLLPGTLRAELLEQGRAREAVLTLRDLDRASAVWLGNSVRGLVRAELIPAPQTDLMPQ